MRNAAHRTPDACAHLPMQCDDAYSLTVIIGGKYTLVQKQGNFDADLQGRKSEVNVIVNNSAALAELIDG